MGMLLVMVAVQMFMNGVKLFLTRRQVRPHSSCMFLGDVNV